MSLGYTKKMTWSEFRIRMYAYHRQQKQEIYRTREVAYELYVIRHGIFGKGSPLSKERYWSIDNDAPDVTESQIKAFRKAKEKYNREKNG